MTGAERIARERRRQVEVKGWTPGHDDEHADGEMVEAAICYAAASNAETLRGRWPWDDAVTSEPRPISYSNTAARIRALEKAGALIAAEIDRLLRATPETSDVRR